MLNIIQLIVFLKLYIVLRFLLGVFFEILNRTVFIADLGQHDAPMISYEITEIEN